MLIYKRASVRIQTPLCLTPSALFFPSCQATEARCQGEERVSAKSDTTAERFEGRRAKPKEGQTSFVFLTKAVFKKKKKRTNRSQCTLPLAGLLGISKKRREKRNHQGLESNSLSRLPLFLLTLSPPKRSGVVFPYSDTYKLLQTKSTDAPLC